MRVLIAGSRILFPNNADIKQAITELEAKTRKDTTKIVQGGAKGVDTCARTYALEESIECDEYLPDYEQYGIEAPRIRNIEMSENADALIAIWTGNKETSPGTYHMIQVALKLGLIVHEVHMFASN